MSVKLVKDLMLPLDQYTLVTSDVTLQHAILALEDSQAHVPTGRQPHRAVLVTDARGKVIGKVGQLAFLRGLEPRYRELGDLGTLARAGVSSEIISSMMSHYHFFQDQFEDVCARASTITVAEVMHPISESIDKEASIQEAIHKIVMLQQLSLLVTDRGEAVGLLRLSDLFQEVAREMKHLARPSTRS